MATENDRPTPKQQRFCEEYIKDSNATQAAIRAGFSERNAHKIGSQLLGKTRVFAEISRLQKELSVTTGVEVRALVKELAKVAFTNIADILEPGDELKVRNLDELTDAQRASILEISETRGKFGVTRKVKLHPKLQAIDMLMKHTGGYVTANELIDRLPEDRLNQLVEEILEKLKR